MSAKRDRTSAEPGPTTPNKKTKRTTLRKSGGGGGGVIGESLKTTSMFICTTIYIDGVRFIQRKIIRCLQVLSVTRWTSNSVDKSFYLFILF